MASYKRRAVVFLVLLVAILQAIHLALICKLEAKKMERVKRSKIFNNGMAERYLTIYETKEINEDKERMWNLVKDSSILDSSGEYRIINYFMRAQSLGVRNHIRNDVTLVTQSSVSRLHNLITIIDRWQGLTSVTVFTISEEIPLAVDAMLLLRRCHPVIRYNTSFHLVYPLRVLNQKQTTPLYASDDIIRVDCENVVDYVESLQPGVMNYGRKGVQFPNNLLRNVGRRNTLTEFVFVTDIDLITSNKLSEQFMEFARENRLFDKSRKEEKNIYVVPAYEMKEDLPEDSIPKDKSDLLRSIQKLEARPFYFELCWKCHKYTDYDAWQKEPPTTKLNVLFEVLWRDPWEPFYISRNNVPFYDERFRQYGFNRISQVCELHLSGHKFSVLNNAFVVHKGLKTMDSFHKEKDLELERNRLLFRQFKNELKDKYPQSSRRCY